MRSSGMVRIFGMMLIAACGCSSSSSSSSDSGAIPTANLQAGTSVPYLGASGSNVLPLTVGGNTLCGSSGAPNVPCTSVTICVPGTDQCETISDIVVDTGSSGLRIFSSAVSIPLPQQNAPGGQPLAECVTFGIGSDWGPVVQAGVQLGGEPVVTTPIQLINVDYAKAPLPCMDADKSAEIAGYNGILGVGPFKQDCGTLCATEAVSQTYYSCPTSASGPCDPITLPADRQLQNPIALLPVDNNGDLIAMPNVPPNGTQEVSGSLILGIGTQSNNIPQSVTPFMTNAAGSYVVTINGRPYPGSAVDSGSNGLFFPNDVGVKECGPGSRASGFYCPKKPTEITALTISAGNGMKGAIQFQVVDANSLVETGNFAFSNLAGSSSAGVILGMPFFYGRAIFTGIEGTSSSLGVGPLWAY